MVLTIFYLFKLDIFTILLSLVVVMLTYFYIRIYGTKNIINIISKRLVNNNILYHNFKETVYLEES